VRVCSNSAAVVGVVFERMTSGRSATSSFAKSRLVSASACVAQRVSILMLRSSVQPAYGVLRGMPPYRSVLERRSRKTPSVRRRVAFHPIAALPPSPATPSHFQARRRTRVSSFDDLVDEQQKFARDRQIQFARCS